MSGIGGTRGDWTDGIFLSFGVGCFIGGALLFFSHGRTSESLNFPSPTPVPDTSVEMRLKSVEEKTDTLQDQLRVLLELKHSGKR